MSLRLSVNRCGFDMNLGELRAAITDLTRLAGEIGAAIGVLNGTSADFIAIYVTGGASTFLMLGATSMLNHDMAKLNRTDAAVWAALSILWPLVVWVVVLSFLLDRE